MVNMVIEELFVVLADPYEYFKTFLPTLSCMNDVVTENYYTQENKQPTHLSSKHTPFAAQTLYTCIITRKWHSTTQKCWCMVALQGSTISEKHEKFFFSLGSFCTRQVFGLGNFALGSLKGEEIEKTRFLPHHTVTVSV